MIFAKLLEMAEASPIHAAGPSGKPEESGNNLLHTRIADALSIDVLGERENGIIVMFAYHEGQRKTVEQRDTDRISYARLTQIAGDPVEKCVDPPGAEGDHNKFSLDQVRTALCYLGGQKQIGDQTLVGVGCWQPQDDQGDDVPGVVAVGAGESAVWDGKTLNRVARPRAGGRLLKFSNSEPWYHFPQLAANLDTCNPEWAQVSIERLAEIFAQWRWKNQEFSPMVVAGLVMASWVQTMWHWRPQVSITGASEAGKSLLFETLGYIFNGLAIRSSKSSAAGVRQAIGTTGKIVLCDEFEEDQHRDALLEMIRASSRGDKILRGTTGQQTKTFVTQHIFWVTAIEVALDRAPDRNRFVSLELLRPVKEMEGKLTPPPPSELHDLGQRLLAIAIKHIVTARPLARRLRAREFPAIDPRVVESYAVPAAILATAIGLSEDGAAGVLGSMLTTATAEDQDVSDEEELVQAILRAEMRSGDNREVMNVAKAIVGITDPSLAETLQRHGIGIVYDNNTGRDLQEQNETRYLFIDDRAVRGRLLRGTKWQNQDIKAILGRLPGANLGQHRLGSRKPRGVKIPMAVLEKRFLVADKW